MIACGSGGTLFGQPKRFPLLLLRGILGFTGMAGAFAALFMLPVHEYMPLFFTYPIFTALFAWILLREGLSLLTFGGMGISIVGLVVLTQPPFLNGGVELTPDKLLGYLTAIGAATAAAGMGALKSSYARVWSHLQNLRMRLISLVFTQ